MKTIPLTPLTEDKIEAYINGELKLHYRRKTGVHSFIKGTPKNTVITTGRKAYFRVWYFRTRVKSPELSQTIDAFYAKHFPKSYRGPRKATVALRATAPAPSAAAAKAPRTRRTNRKALGAYRKGYNSAYRSQGAKIEALEKRLAQADPGFWGSMARLFGSLNIH